MTKRKMFPPTFSIFLAIFISFSLVQTPVFAEKKRYIVYMGSHSNAAITRTRLHGISDSHFDFLGSFLGGKQKAKDAIYYSYRRHINGFAATLDEEVAAEIAKHPMVVSIFPDHIRKLQTTRSWDFLSLEKNGNLDTSSLWKQARFGEDIIIANLDSGVWPESKSFSDEGYGPVPKKWLGICQNDTVDGVHCNRKLIGARYFNKGYEELLKSTNNSYDPLEQTARDHNGHGTHTLSTAAGNFVPRVNVFGLGNGTAKGGAPRARVAAYKVCWSTGCHDSDTIKAFDRAIDDGVDVISVSIGSNVSKPYLEDGVAIGSFQAVKHGIVVVTAAGNDGPLPGSVTNGAPWYITVAASTIDRQIVNYVHLRNGLRLKGTSTPPKDKALPGNRFYPLVTGAQAKAGNALAEKALRCLDGTLDPEKVKGKILVCQNGESRSVQQGEHALLSGAVGMIVCNDFEASGGDLPNDPPLLTASHINSTACESVIAYINSTKNPLGLITASTVEIGTKPAPVMPFFSSRGPNNQTLEILKPDITAPGVGIIAANTETKLERDKNEPSGPFAMLEGTSMSCPHVAGVAGLLKAIHPDWSPAAIRSAIMTTATTNDNTGSPIRNIKFEETPLAYGAGHIQPNLAVDPGLVYDLKARAYKDFLCALGYNESTVQRFAKSRYRCPQTPINVLNLNYPSITVPHFSGTVTISRILKNVGSPAIYTARVNEPRGVSVTVKPSVLVFKRVGQQKRFNLTITAKGPDVPKVYVFGDLIWSDHTHTVRSPITVAPNGATNTHQ